MNRLVVLGSGGDAPLVARQQRSAGGLVLVLEGHQFHLDPGPGSLAAARAAKVHPRETIGILVSSSSLLHANDVNAAVMAMTMDGMDKHGVLLAAKSVLEGEGEQPALLLPYYKRCLEGVVTVVPGSKLGVNHVTIEGVRVQARDPSAVGFKLSTERFVIGYVPETSWFDTLPDEFRGCDILVVHCKHPAQTREDGYLNEEEAQRVIAGAQPRVAFLTGFGEKLANPVESARHVQRETKTHCIALADGQSVDLHQFVKK